jgi:L-aspartate oxidase
LASRDIVSQSIDLELKKSGDDCVYLDCTHLELDPFIKHFPMIYEHCKSIGIDITKDWIPVVPAQHYLCGGIVVDCNGKTSIENLFACGECSRTGLHGANRLASNSLLEALVYSDKIYCYLSNATLANKKPNAVISDWELNKMPEINLDYLTAMKAKLQLLMRQNAGIVRYDAELLKAKEQLLLWQNEMEEIGKTHQINAAFYELLNMMTIAYLIVQQSIDRKENQGGFVKFKLAK